jgi:hypothetical protein
MTHSDGAIDLDYKAMWEDENVKNESLTNGLNEAKKKIESLQQSTAAKIPEKPAKAAPKRPTFLNEDIHDAAKKGDLDSVAFLLYQDPSLIAKKDEDDHSLTLERHRFTKQHPRTIPRWLRSFSRTAQRLTQKPSRSLLP